MGKSYQERVKELPRYASSSNEMFDNQHWIWNLGQAPAA